LFLVGRQTGSYPETGLGDINGDLSEADFWPGCALGGSTFGLPVTVAFTISLLFIPWLVKTLGVSQALPPR
jgi:hypothetical protein